jgi:3-oxoacyl-[acyl-carrier-protein] synthase III
VISTALKASFFSVQAVKMAVAGAIIAKAAIDFIVFCKNERF